ncbi:MAG: hypothetical protein R1F54_07510 [Candidatus Zeuxoniibacter abyssi]|nr:MAG: hypothetical protein R1F54_07510 [Candidatus Persebacteraceae bacterium AB1(2)]
MGARFAPAYAFPRALPVGWQPPLMAMFAPAYAFPRALPSCKRGMGTRREGMETRGLK